MEEMGSTGRVHVSDATARGLSSEHFEWEEAHQTSATQASELGIERTYYVQRAPPPDPIAAAEAEAPAPPEAESGHAAPISLQAVKGIVTHSLHSLCSTAHELRHSSASLAESLALHHGAPPGRRASRLSRLTRLSRRRSSSNRAPPAPVAEAAAAASEPSAVVSLGEGSGGAPGADVVGELAGARSPGDVELAGPGLVRLSTVLSVTDAGTDSNRDSGRPSCRPSAPCACASAEASCSPLPPPAAAAAAARPRAATAPDPPHASPPCSPPEPLNEDSCGASSSTITAERSICPPLPYQLSACSTEPTTSHSVRRRRPRRGQPSMGARRTANGQGHALHPHHGMCWLAAPHRRPWSRNGALPHT